ncbi:N-6 DNA methylase [Promethearchaeum syntrophicum]|uniref:site-specific DNA-methyltransferase (adenine-specific) n=1 Tax=Promethearchaeum syntrophicum TaxID=2594042 RepID=A0A5B9D9W7_9ARCH|nr:N-6 DNA methylase [Candidatus Prometheoarchaeum syntrophicum]QEE15627.1 hypothetical protein DSAG12_01453 [Candidatus Prometheoarchaeum syntrophicum]
MVNGALFKETTIKRLCENVEVNKVQKEAISRWLNLLDTGQLKDEKKAYIEFANTILHDILDYEIGIEYLQHERGNMEFPILNPNKDKIAVYFECKGLKQKDLFGKQYRKKIGYETPVSQTWTKMSEYPIPYGVCTNYDVFILLDYTKGNQRYYQFKFRDILKDESKIKEFIGIFSKRRIIDEKFLETLYLESDKEEKSFSSEFYKIYHETRLMLIKEFQFSGLGVNLSIKYAQIFLNRILFIYFAESTNKISKNILENSILPILKNPLVINEKSTFVYQGINVLFNKFNSGSESPIKIFGFNGGLFEEDFPPEISFRDLRRKNYYKEIYLNSKLRERQDINEYLQEIIKIFSGELNELILNIILMGRFDFTSEISILILGHIFEQSISDIEKLKGDDIKIRKKEGIFYTPEFITEYLCRNTIIPFLSKKGGIPSIPNLIAEYEENIEELDEKLLNVKILDLSCGSGAFLIKTVDILLDIKREIMDFKEMQGKYITKNKNKKIKSKDKKVPTYFKLEKFQEIKEAIPIIKNNIFGVDINEESVELTKLSIFFKILQRNEKLMNLSNIIKCGNSLINDSSIDKTSAFNWEENYPNILPKKKFDIIIGNPPWGAEFNADSLKFLKKEYEDVCFRVVNSFKMFIKKALSLLSPNGAFGYIVPNGIIEMPDYFDVRRELLHFSKKLKVIDLGDNVFEDVDYPSAIITFPNTINSSEIIELKDLKLIPRSELNVFELEKDEFNQLPIEKLDEKFRFRINSLEFLEKNTLKLKEKYFTIFGVKVYQKGKGISYFNAESSQIQRDKDENVYLSNLQTHEHTNKFYSGKNISKYYNIWKSGNNDSFINYGRHLAEPRNLTIFNQKKIIIQQIVNKTILATITEEEIIVKNTCAVINQIEDEYSLELLLSLINSKFFTYTHLKKHANAIKKNFPKLNSNDLKDMLIPIITENNKSKVEMIEKLSIETIEFGNKFSIKYNNFMDYLSLQYSISISDIYFKIHKTLNLEIEQESKDNFFNILKKQKLNIEKKDIFENIISYFKELRDFKNQISKNYRTIDNLVYELYGLDEKIVKEIEKIVRY